MRVFVLIAGLAVAGLGLGCRPQAPQAELDELAKDRRLKLELKVVRWPKLLIRVTNLTPAQVNIWQPGCSWGDEQFTLRLRKANGEAIDESLMDGGYSGNFPRPQAIPAQQSVEFEADIGGRDLAIQRSGPWKSAEMQLNIVADGDTKAHSVICGSWVSEPVALPSRPVATPRPQSTQPVKP